MERLRGFKVINGTSEPYTFTITRSDNPEVLIRGAVGPGGTYWWYENPIGYLVFRDCHDLVYAPRFGGVGGTITWEFDWEHGTINTAETLLYESDGQGTLAEVEEDDGSWENLEDE